MHISKPTEYLSLSPVSMSIVPHSSIGSFFHWVVHLALLEKPNNNQACCYSILPKCFSQIPTKITFLYALLTTRLEEKIVGWTSKISPKWSITTV